MSLAPILKNLTVDPGKLLLDPNNPRLFTQEEEVVPLERVKDPGVQSATSTKMCAGDDKFRIRNIADSIRTNGYIPEAGGYIFVRKLHGSEYYLVLEGNRRLVAIRQLLNPSGDKPRDVAQGIIETLNPIDVLEIVDSDEKEIQSKVSYLLGTCHHGSHKDWSPFAQARGIYKRYTKLTGQDGATFQYDSEKGQEVAALLSIKESEVKERLAVYRAMQQLAAAPEMQSKPKGGIVDNYYSLVFAAVCSKEEEIKMYIPKDPNTFTLEEVAIQRMINLCNFDGTKDRRYEDGQGVKRAPAMNNPKQWRYLCKILGDSNDDKRTQNLALVEEEYQQPEEVWARRSQELRQYTWKKWLEQVYGILKEVGIGEDFESDAAREAISNTHTIVAALGEHNGGTHA